MNATGMRARWARMPVASRVRAVVTGTVLLAALSLVPWLLAGISDTGINPWQLVLLVVMLPASEMALLHVRFGADHYSFTWGEACVLVGACLVPPVWLVLLAGPCVVGVHLLARRAPLKALFNGAAFALSASLACGVIVILGDSPYQITEGVDALALMLGVTVYSIVSAGVTSCVLAVAQQRSLSSILRDNVRMAFFVWAGNVAAASLMLALAERSRSTLLGIPPLVVAVFIAYRGYLSARQERDIWQQLEAAGRELNVLEEEDVAAAALMRARELFRTDRVELVLLATARSSARVYTLEEDGSAVARPCSDEDASGSGTMRFQQVGTDGSDGLFTCLVSPLDGPRGRIGALRLLFEGPVKLTARERQVLVTFGHSVCTTILNVGLYDDMRAEAARQAHEASHDPLTGLANRILLNERTRAAMAAAPDRTTALLLLDLDHFKEINDTLGHAAGDYLLQRIGERLRRLGGTDVVARLGGDEFAVLLTGLPSPAAAEPVADRLLRMLAEPVDYDGLRLSVEGSVGIACYPQDAAESSELFRRADVAMYQAKSSRGSWVRYDASRDDSSLHRLALVAELRAAVELKQLVVYYQPQLDLDTGLISAAEALCRWQHPTRGLLPPSEFISAAEQSGLVRPFTMYVLEEAVRECALWQTNGRPLSVAVNLSARSLLDRQLADDVAAVLERHGLPADRLVLEITETSATSELEVVEDVLSRLRRLGVQLSVDDFGTGYSSLAFLQRTAVNELKVDKSFVSGMLESENDLALVRATIQLAHSLGARAVAEGVEHEEFATALRALGCDVAQGYWLSKPVPAEQVRPLLANSEHAFPVTTVTTVPVQRQVAPPDGRRLWAVEG